MKTFSFINVLLTASLLVVLSFAPACTTDEVVNPTSAELRDSKVLPRADFSGLEAQVKLKIAERDNLSTSVITSCYYYGTTSEGYGQYNFTTSIPTSGSYFVTGIIGDEIEGF